MAENRGAAPPKKAEPGKLEDLEAGVLEVVSHALVRDRLAPGGVFITESLTALDRRPLPYPRWRCNECHFEFASAKLRDLHEAGHWRTSEGEGLGISFMGHQALLDMVPASSRPLVLEAFINSPRTYKQDGLPPAPEIFQVPYDGTQEGSALASSEQR